MTRDVRMKGFGRRSSVADVDAWIAERVASLGIERVPLRSALGRILAADVVADRSIPPHPKSAMDGYAVRARDLPGTLEVVGELVAAAQIETPLRAGQAVRIMTGAKVPDGADTVVAVEETTLDGNRVAIDSPQSAGQHVLRTGEDFAEGRVVLSAGRRIRPQDLAMLASVSRLEVAVHIRPRVRIIPTGSELVRLGVRPTGSEVVESNSLMLEALAMRDHADVTVHSIIRDDRTDLERALLDANADLVVVTGGSSVGVEDLGPVVVRAMGELPIHGVSIKPASPTGLGFVGKTVVLLAPGFPVASYVAWDLFARAIVQRMEGAPGGLPYATTSVRLAKTHKKPVDRVEVQRIALSRSSEDSPIATILPGGAALLSTLTHADAFLLLPAGRDTFEAGSELPAHLYA